MHDYEILEEFIELLTEEGFIRNRDRCIELAKEKLKRIGVNVEGLWNEELYTLLIESPKSFLETDVLKKIINEVYKNSDEKEKFFRIDGFSRKDSIRTIIFNAIDDIEGKKEYIINHPFQLSGWIANDLLEVEDIKKFAFVEMIKNNFDDIEYASRRNLKKHELELSEVEDIYESIHQQLMDYYQSYRIDGRIIQLISKTYECVSNKNKIDFLLSKVPKISLENDYTENGILRTQISCIYNSLTKKEQEELLNQLPDNFAKAKLLYSAEKIEDENFLEIFFNFFKDFEKADIEKLKIKLALHNLDFDAIVGDNFFDKIKDETDFINSQGFSDLLNVYYNGLSKEERKEFYTRLAFSSTTGTHIAIYEKYKPEEVKKIFDINLGILSKIQDENKFDYMSWDFKYGLLVTGVIEEPKTQFEIFIEMIENHNVNRVAMAMKKLKMLNRFPEIELEPEEIGELFERLNNSNNLITNDKCLGVVANLISTESMKKYLETKPAEVFNIIDFYDADFFSKLDVDEFYKAKLLLTSKANFSDMTEFFFQIDDEYLRTEILLSKHSDRIISVKAANYYINQYEMVKQEFLDLPTQEEKVNYLIGANEGRTVEEMKEFYKRINDIKKSLVKYIDNHDDRMKIIDSMQRYVQPEIKQYSDLAESMIKEFFEDNGGLSEEMQERMETVFRTNDIFFVKSYSESNVTGQCRYLDNDISVARYRENEPEKLLLDLIHEISHGFSNAKFKSNVNHIGRLTEEGMADVFSETILNYYFQKHKSIEINGETIHLQLPLVSTSSYHKENAYVRTMLYPLYQKGEEIEALKEFTLGDKSKFVELALGEDFLAYCNKNHLGMPDMISISYGDVYSGNREGFKVIDENSLYARKNYLLPALHMQSIMDEKRN